MRSANGNQRANSLAPAGGHATAALRASRTWNYGASGVKSQVPQSNEFEYCGFRSVYGRIQGQILKDMQMSPHEPGSSYFYARSSERDRPHWHVAHALIISAGVCAAIFLVYEIIEVLWIQQLSSRTLAMTRAVRGLAAALVATLVAAAYLLGRVVPSLESSLAFSTPRNRQVQIRENLANWIIGLRWIAVFAAAGVVGFATMASRRITPESVPYLWAGVLGLALFNGALSLWPWQLSSRAALVLQVSGDVVTLGWLLHFSGGLQNPFSVLFVFHGAIAAVVLETRQARGVAWMICGFVLVLAVFEAGILPPVCILGEGRTACPDAVDWMLTAAAAAAVAVAVVGCSFIVSVLVEVLRTEREVLAQTFAVLADRTEDLAATQEQVREEHERLQMILDCMADVVLYITADGKVRLRNRAAQELWPKETPSDGDLTVCHSVGKWKELVERVAVKDGIELHPVFQVRKRSYEASYARVCDSSGTFRGVVMVARDVTERIETQQLRMRGEQMAVVGKLAAALAHELNNPLGAIALFTQHALGEVDPSDPLAEYLGTVMRNANLCKKIVRDLLEYARQRPPERQLVVLVQLLGDVLRTLEPHAQTCGVTIQSEMNIPEDIRVYGDPDQLRQVLVNLGLNSIEAMPGRGLLTFTLTASAEGSLRIAVADTGIGIPAEEQERIFAAFHTTKPQGTGLGLTVARDLIAANRGTIEFESTPGQGSTFTVTLPLTEREDAVEANS